MNADSKSMFTELQISIFAHIKVQSFLEISKSFGSAFFEVIPKYRSGDVACEDDIIGDMFSEQERIYLLRCQLVAGHRLVASNADVILIETNAGECTDKKLEYYIECKRCIVFSSTGMLPCGVTASQGITTLAVLPMPFTWIRDTRTELTCITSEVFVEDSSCHVLFPRDVNGTVYCADRKKNKVTSNKSVKMVDDSDFTLRLSKAIEKYLRAYRDAELQVARFALK